MRNSNPKPEISVILPVYNTELYLERCLKSLQNQSFTNWEALCVDDGSTDRCPEILDRYAAADPRIRVVHKANGGVSSARNLALGQIRGAYALLMDSDDFFHPQLMELCLHFARLDHSDLVCFTYDHGFYRRCRDFRGDAFPEFRSYNLARIRRKVVDPLLPWTTEYAWCSHLLRHHWIVKHCQPWRCLYRSEIIRPIRFPEGVIFEDLPWWGAVVLHSGRTTILNLPLYFYSNNERGYLHATPGPEQIRSLRTVIDLSRQYFAAHATPEQQALWEKEFLTPFRKRLIRWEKRLTRDRGSGPECGPRS